MKKQKQIVVDEASSEPEDDEQLQDEEAKHSQGDDSLASIGSKRGRPRQPE